MKSTADVQKAVSAKIIEFQKYEKMSLTGMSEITRANPTYILKRKLLLWVHGLRIKEV